MSFESIESRIENRSAIPDALEDRGSSVNLHLPGTVNNKGKEVFILGDINIDFLKYNDNNQTSEYLDMLLDQEFMPLITKATHLTVIKVIKAGICLEDVSDHLPIFCTVANKPSILNDAKYFRDFSHFDSNSFLSDVEAIDFCGLVHDDINQSINDLVDILQRISDKHAPKRRLNNKKETTPK